jgi:hypothetical protein
MPWQPDGTFQRLYSWDNEAAAGFDILSGRMDADTNDVVGGLERARNLDGINTPSSDLPMGGHRHTGVAAATAPTHYARFDQVMPLSGGTFSGPVTVNGALHSTGVLTTDSSIGSAGHLSVGAGGADITGPVTVNGALTGTGHLTMAGGLDVTAGGAGVVGGLTVTDGLVVSTGGLIVAASGITVSAGGVNVVAGSLNVAGGASTGPLTVNGYLNVSGGSEIHGPVFLVDASGNTSFSTSLGVPHFYQIPGQGDVAIFDGGMVDIRGTAQVQNALAVGGAAMIANSVNVTGNYYRNSTVIPVLAEAFNSALAAADDGAVMLLVKRGGEVAVRPVVLGEPDAEGRRALYLAAEG